MEFFAIARVFFLTALSFALAMLLTPLWTRVLYHFRLGKSIRAEASTPIYTKLHQHKAGTPTMGGVLIWGTVALVALLFWAVAQFDVSDSVRSLNFINRAQTLLPIGVLLASALVGLLDDFLNINRVGPAGGGLRVRHKLLLYTGIALVGAWWFFVKLDWDIIRVPFIGTYEIGWWYIPIFLFIIIATAFSANETDGLDGLAGGTLLIAFASMGTVAFVQGRYDLTAFCGVIIGALLAFLWFNVPPARFFMGDTGSMSLGITLGVLAMLTNTFLLLPLFGIIFVGESLSVIIQLTSKKLRGGKKVFLSSPIHHHFEAKGWPEAKIVMRFWIISGVVAVVGLILALLDRVW